MARSRHLWPRFLAWIAVATTCLAAAPATARDMTGKAGLGLLVTTERMPMASFRYWRTRLATEILVGYSSLEEPLPAAPPDVLSVQRETDHLRLAIGLHWRIGDEQRSSLTLGVRPWLQIRTVRTTREVSSADDAAGEPLTLIEETDESSLLPGLELPLQAELFLNDHFSIQGTMAASLTLGRPPVSSPQGFSSRASGSSLVADLGGGFSGGLGFSYYF